MAKLILSLENKLLGEYRLDKERTSIGRRPANDIYIDNLAVSGEHAAILKVGNDYYVQDLDSTNGTYVNSKAIKQYHLKNADVIDFGKYKLEYINEQVSAPSAQSEIKASLEKISELMKNENNTSQKMPFPSLVTTSTKMQGSHTDTKINNITLNATAKIQVLNGSSVGKELVLNKTLTTLGEMGAQLAVITKRSDGYYVTHIEGNDFPRVNGNSIGGQTCILNNHDVIELDGVKMEFYLDKVPF